MRIATKKMMNLSAVREVCQFRIVSVRGAITSAKEIEASEESTESQKSEAKANISVFESQLSKFLAEYEEIELKGRELLQEDLTDIIQNNTEDILEDLINE